MVLHLLPIAESMVNSVNQAFGTFNWNLNSKTKLWRAATDGLVLTNNKISTLNCTRDLSLILMSHRMYWISLLLF